MNNSNESEPKYKVYTNGPDYCAELINGTWRAVIHDSDDNFVAEVYDEKPDRFVEFEFLTQDQIYDRDMELLISEVYETEFILEGA